MVSVPVTDCPALTTVKTKSAPCAGMAVVQASVVVVLAPSTAQLYGPLDEPEVSDDANVTVVRPTTKKAPSKTTRMDTTALSRMEVTFVPPSPVSF
jgi:hypothetical protein